ncbi:MAG: HEAT repeat domain-containing protein [Candidatus Thiodiazotropha sp.]
MSIKQAPDALLLLASGCAHCPAVLQGLSDLLKQGKIGRLEAVNVAEHPEVARRLGTRSVPWTRIGRFELEGVLTPGELEHWCELAGGDAGTGSYFSHLLETQRADRVVAWLQQDPETIHDLLSLLEQPETPMAVRIGIGVVAEELQGSPLWQSALKDLLQLAQSTDPALRADAAHYLGLTHCNAAAKALRGMADDNHPDVREIATESLELLQRENTDG